MMRTLPALLSLAACGGSDLKLSPARGSPALDSAVEPSTPRPEPTTPAPTPTPTPTLPSSPPLTPATEPPPPTFPPVVGTVSLRVRTGSGENDGTDDPQQVCLSATDDSACFTLDRADYDDNEAGSLGVWHFEGVGLPRSAITALRLRTTAGADRFVPTCVDVRLDGEPIYCRDDLPVWIGDDPAAGEVLSWVDPDGLTSTCLSCEGGPITHGPLLGAGTEDGFQVLVRTDATRRVVLRAGEREDLSDAVDAAIGWTRPEDDFVARLTARGGVRGRRYFYRVLVDGQELVPPAPARAAPVAGAPRRLIFGSCAKDESQPIFATIAAADPDLFLLVGDAHYANSGHLNTLFTWWRWSWERPERADLLARVPNAAVWDDHDFVDNNSYGADQITWPPGEREAALRALSAYNGNPSFGTPSTPGVFGRLPWGEVDVFLLDGRYHRENPGSTDDPTLLGTGQLLWLLDELRASTATFKLLVSGSTWSPFTTNPGDAWQAHAAERDLLFDLLAAEGLGGVVLLSGDVHRSELRRLTHPGVSWTLPELVSSNLAYPTASSCPASAPDLVACWDGGTGYVQLDFETLGGEPTLTATLRDADGDERGRLVLPRSSLGP